MKDFISIAAQEGSFKKWKYILPPLGFLGLMAINYLAIQLLQVDVGQVMQQEVAKKGANRVVLESLIPFVVFLGLLFLWVKLVHKQTLKSLTTTRKKIDWKRILFSFFMISVFTVVMTFIDYKSNPENYLYNFNTEKFTILFVIAIILVPIQTSFEEYFFRGYLMQGLGLTFKNRWLPFLVTSLMFGLMHLGNPEVGKLGPIIMVYYIGTGLFLGLITLMDEGMELALGFHAGNNLTGILLVTANWTAFQSDSILKDMAEPEAGLDILLPVIIIYPIFTFIMAKMYNWKNWKQKLFGRVYDSSSQEKITTISES
ncbi:CPBP family intramembrane glutamic endopeptidase [Mesonia aestuariivivens]|uniref:CPBP family intramembrane metalloprotease n=1 Tax=Mesonia aestuariivivens TaxID=2796128 RepID=A0ABS6W2G3_9FLAO|nr:CPBP family intramembrane glutamic endopeptidase [Mesonia aestuariivivens]MBW2962047.1 CPBP family intramembrane metalloprotease [Mesonia aestuariivivens]